ncbi:MAG: hypothetical protein ACE141_02705 [Bryobacteraceae bacterium]
MTAHRGLLALLLLAFAVTACCDDLSGKWQWEMAASGGRTQYTLTLKQEGESLTGTLGSGEDVMPLRDGKVSGDKLSFVIARTWGKRETTMTYQGRVFGDEIRFRVFMPGAERSWDITARRVP